MKRRFQLNPKIHTNDRPVWFVVHRGGGWLVGQAVNIYVYNHGPQGNRAIFGFGEKPTQFCLT